MVDNNLTELPEKWIIKITDENISVINKARKKLNGHYIDSLSINFNYLANNCSNDDYPNDIVGNVSPEGALASGHIEITTEQFEKWVLKKEVNVNIVLW